jgi:Fe2+ transport system protein FeoA
MMISDAHKTLADLAPTELAVVQTISLESTHRQRLLEMGLLNDTPVKMIRRAPFGDPIEIELRGYKLSLRLEEAGQVILKP